MGISVQSKLLSIQSLLCLQHTPLYIILRCFICLHLHHMTGLGHRLLPFAISAKGDSFIDYSTIQRDQCTSQLHPPLQRGLKNPPGLRKRRSIAFTGPITWQHKHMLVVDFVCRWVVFSPMWCPLGCCITQEEMEKWAFHRFPTWKMAIDDDIKLDVPPPVWRLALWSRRVMGFQYLLNGL